MKTFKKLFLSLLVALPCFCSTSLYAQECPNDEIWYESSSKLTETTSSFASGLHTNAFNTTIASHTFSSGKGIIKFNGKVTSIGNYAFRNCSSLSSITIPNHVTSIGEGAFLSCSNLASVTIPNSVTSIGERAFLFCSSLPVINNLRYADTYLVGAVDKTLSTYNIKEGTKWIGSSAFTDCSNLTSINIQNSVMSIGECAFFGCSCLASVTIPNSVRSLGYRAFYDCSSLTSITIPNSVTYIGDDSFGACSSLPVIDNVRYADTYLVAAVDKTLTTYIIKEGTKWIGSTAFHDCSILASITIPNSVTTIGSSAFVDCTSLTSITIPISVKTIGSTAFYGCSSLASIIIPNSVTSIEDGAFINCSSLASITIPNSVKSIGSTAFFGCSCLASITLGSSVTSIGGSAFAYCSSLANVYCYAGQVPSTGSYLFSSVPLSSATLYVPMNSIDSFKATSPWSGFGTITNIPGPNVFITDLSDNTSKIEVKSNDSFSLLDNIKSIEITDTISSVNLTYTRNFTDAMVGNWQAWYMPCDFDYDDLSEDFDVAEVAGVLFDKDGQNYVAFRKMTEGTVKAHIPYVVRAKEAGDAVITTTTTLQPTDVTKTHTIQSSYNNFTFGGVYENSYLSAESPTYAMSKSGNFALMGSSVYLRPFRIYMRITDREDNPYAAVTTPQEVKVVVLGEDETSVDEIHNAQFIIHNDDSSEIYNLGGQKLQKLQKGINIVNGRKVLF